MDLIYQEFPAAWRQTGESPGAEEYVRRFPVWSEAIIRQFAMDEAMRTADDLTVPFFGGGPGLRRGFGTGRNSSRQAIPARFDRRVRAPGRAGPGRHGGGLQGA